MELAGRQNDPEQHDHQDADATGAEDVQRQLAATGGRSFRLTHPAMGSTICTRTTAGHGGREEAPGRSGPQQLEQLGADQGDHDAFLSSAVSWRNASSSCGCTRLIS